MDFYRIYFYCIFWRGLGGVIWHKKEYDLGFPDDFRFYIVKRNAYLRSSIIWMSMYYWLYLVSILSTIIVIYLSSLRMLYGKIFFYSVVSLFFIFAELVLQPKKISYGYRKAFMIIDKELNMCKSEKLICAKCMAQCLAECEKVLCKVHK